MKIKIKTDTGYNIFNSIEIEEYIASIVKLVPGVYKITTKSHLKKLINKLSRDKHFGIEVVYLPENKIGIEVYVVLISEVSIVEITTSVQELIKYELEHKYGIYVEFVNVYVRGIK